MQELEALLDGAVIDPALAALTVGLDDESLLESLTPGGNVVPYNPETPGDFDYGGLAADVVADARQVAERFRAHHKATVITTIEIGEDLIRVKNGLPRGKFGSWLKAEFGRSARAAQLYMGAAQAFGQQPEAISYLPPTTVYRLAAPSTPNDVRAQVIEAVKAGDPLTPGEIQAKLSVASREAKLRAREARMSPAAKKRRAKMAAEDEARILDRRREESDRNDMRARAVEILECELSAEALTEIARIVLKVGDVPEWLTDWAQNSAATQQLAA